LYSNYIAHESLIIIFEGPLYEFKKLLRTIQGKEKEKIEFKKKGFEKGQIEFIHRQLYLVALI